MHSTCSAQIIIFSRESLTPFPLPIDIKLFVKHLTSILRYILSETVLIFHILIPHTRKKSSKKHLSNCINNYNRLQYFLSRVYGFTMTENTYFLMF